MFKENLNEHLKLAVGTREGIECFQSHFTWHHMVRNLYNSKIINTVKILMYFTKGVITKSNWEGITLFSEWGNKTVIKDT